jgi:hypothetical protein
MSIAVSGSIEFQPDVLHKDGGQYFIYNSIGEGWAIPTKDISPADLRALADHLELGRALRNGTRRIAESCTENGELVAITLEDDAYRIVAVLYEAPDPRPGLEVVVARDRTGRVTTVYRQGNSGDFAEVLYRAPAYHCDPLPAGCNTEGG